MRRSILIATALLVPLWLGAPADAQTQPSTEQILQACASDQIRTLPVPYTDVPADHWAFEAVMKMYYCGPYRGQLAADELRRLQSPRSQIGEIASLPPMNTLLSAPLSVKIENRQYVLSTYLWRDFMPISPPGGKPLIASIRVSASDNKAFPSSLKVDRLWAIKDKGEVWETELAGQGRQPTANQLEKVARNGPKWEPGTKVDVVVRLVDKDNRTYLLRAAQQLINRTD
ncbi:MAG: hypothetical protein MUC60_09680 [Oscillatoria sp. Prado101]|jgi:hypothetical protein|nr:hypothetical protein [Oscillatoria sp. Prado101]